MVDDIHVALGIPILVKTALGDVEVREMSATSLVMVTQEVVAIIHKIWRPKLTELEALANLHGLMLEEPTLLTGLIARATRKSADNLPLTGEQIGDLPLHELFELGVAFIDQHEKSISGFFVLKGRWEKMALSLPKGSPSRKSSTPLSPADGPSPTSENSPSDSLNSTPGASQSVPSMSG